MLKETKEFMDLMLATTKLGVAVSDGIGIGDLTPAMATATKGVAGIQGMLNIPNELSEATDADKDEFVKEYSSKLSDTLSVNHKKKVVEDLLDSVVLIVRSAYALLSKNSKGLDDFSAKEYLNI